MDNHPVESPALSPPTTPAARPRPIRLLAIAVAVAVGIAVAGATIALRVGLFSPKAPAVCAGMAAYSGTVTDSVGRGLGGVIVTLSPSRLQSGTRTNVSTNDSGTWSATLSGGCAYDALLHWRSPFTGPLLANASDLPRDSLISVDVADQTISLVLFAEYAHDPNATISVDISAGTEFSLDAISEGNISLGFLAVDAAGRPGVNFTVPERIARASTGSFALVYSGAKGYRVVDILGDSLIYVVPTPEGHFGFTDAMENLTMQEAISLDEAANIYPYVQIAGHGTDTTWWNVTKGTGIPLAAGVTAFGLPLVSTFTVGGSTYARFTVTLVNSGSPNECYVWYNKSFSIHIWYYSTKCP